MSTRPMRASRRSSMEVIDLSESAVDYMDWDKSAVEPEPAAEPAKSQPISKQRNDDNDDGIEPIVRNSVLKHLAKSQAIAVPAKKTRGRPPKAMTSTAVTTVSSAKKKQIAVEDIAEHESLVMKMTRYSQSRFAPYLRENKVKFDNLRQLNLDELHEMNENIKMLMAVRQHVAFIPMAVLGVAGTIEGITTKNQSIKAKVDLTGYTAALAQDPALAELMEEVSLEYSVPSLVSPTKRLIFALSMTAMNVAAMNRQKSVHAYYASQSEPIDSTRNNSSTQPLSDTAPPVPLEL